MREFKMSLCVVWSMCVCSSTVWYDVLHCWCVVCRRMTSCCSVWSVRTGFIRGYVLWGSIRGYVLCSSKVMGYCRHDWIGRMILIFNHNLVDSIMLFYDRLRAMVKLCLFVHLWCFQRYCNVLILITYLWCFERRIL